MHSSEETTFCILKQESEHRLHGVQRVSSKVYLPSIEDQKSHSELEALSTRCLSAIDLKKHAHMKPSLKIRYAKAMKNNIDESVSRDAARISQHVVDDGRHLSLTELIA